MHSIERGWGNALSHYSTITRADRILIVDDVADNREVLTRRLKRKNYQTVEAADGHQALKLLHHAPFDLVLLDIMMPGMSGLEVLSEIRETLALRNLPVVMVTADAFKENVAKARALGANDYVTKPIDFIVVLACIEMHLRLARTAARIADARESLRIARE